MKKFKAIFKKDKSGQPGAPGPSGAPPPGQQVYGTIPPGSNPYAPPQQQQQHQQQGTQYPQRYSLPATTTLPMHQQQFHPQYQQPQFQQQQSQQQQFQQQYQQPPAQYYQQPAQYTHPTPPVQSNRFSAPPPVATQSSPPPEPSVVTDLSARAVVSPGSPLPAQSPPPAQEEPSNSSFSFNIQVDKTLWPAFELGEDTGDLIQSAGQLFIDYTDSLSAQWCRGIDVGGHFGKQLFIGDADPNGRPVESLPPLLFDLVTNKVVRSSEVGNAHYVAISHVWGQTTQLDGSRYGVSWSIPIRSEQRLLQILEAVRVICGERYIWMDVLCMDQRNRNEAEIPKMKTYFSNALGCFVWLDNPYNETGWDRVLNSIRAVNKFFNMDQHGNPLPGSLERLIQGGSAFDLSLKEAEAFEWLQNFVKLQQAPWFKRVWTLQEGVIPNKVYFCTPERVMTGGANLWTISALMEMMTKALVEAGSMVGTAIAHQLQRSEVHKMLKLRQLYRKQQISYWHLVQAVRTRECMYEQDKVFGVCGLMHKTNPVITYNRSLDSLYNDMYKIYIEHGDFDACLFVGGDSAVAPIRDVSMGSIKPRPSERTETHTLHISQNALQMQGVGYDRVTKVHCILSWGDALKAWSKTHPHFLDMPTDAHFDIARAFGLEAQPFKDQTICPASFAAIMALSINSNPQATSLLGPEFQEYLEVHIPAALLQWIRLTYLVQKRDDSAVIMIWTQSSGVQLAIVNEPLDGCAVIALMPSSYKDNPGPGCLVGRVLPDGSVKKVGVGLGREVKALDIASFIEVK
jgi:hypothetical protein